MPASIDDILTAIKNIPTGLSALTSTWRRGQGNLTTAALTGSTVVCSGSGRLVSVTIIAAGSADGTIFNSASTANATSGAALYTISHSGGTGMFAIGMEFNAGLVVVPGSGQTICLTYYQGP